MTGLRHIMQSEQAHNAARVSQMGFPLFVDPCVGYNDDRVIEQN